MDNYDGNNWGQNGPKLVTRVLNGQCNNMFKKITDTTQCTPLNLTVFPSRLGYPIHWSQINLLFDPNKMESTLKAVENSHFVHISSSITKTYNVRKDFKSPFIIISQRACPITYGIADNYFQ
jgi:lactosylceramide 4-alpha-galactosyltransferase